MSVSSTFVWLQDAATRRAVEINWITATIVYLFHWVSSTKVEISYNLWAINASPGCVWMRYANSSEFWTLLLNGYKMNQLDTHRIWIFLLLYSQYRLHMVAVQSYLSHRNNVLFRRFCNDLENYLFVKGAIKGYLCHVQVDNSLGDMVEGLRDLDMSDQQYNWLALQDHQRRNFYRPSIFHILLHRFQRMFQLKLGSIEISENSVLGISLIGRRVEPLLGTMLVLQDLNIPIQGCTLLVNSFQNFCTSNGLHIYTYQILMRFWE